MGFWLGTCKGRISATKSEETNFWCLHQFTYSPQAFLITSKPIKNTRRMKASVVLARRVIKSSVDNANDSFKRIVLINEMSKRMIEKATLAQQQAKMNTTFASENTSFKRMVMINEMGKKMEQQAREAASKVLKQQGTATQEQRSSNL
jgi:hypothetical protein